MDGAYEGVGGWEGGGGGWQAGGRPSLPLGTDSSAVFPADDRNVHNHRIDRDSRWQQFDTQPILISTPQWVCWPCNAPTRFTQLTKSRL